MNEIQYHLKIFYLTRIYLSIIIQKNLRKIYPNNNSQKYIKTNIFYYLLLIE